MGGNRGWEEGKAKRNRIREGDLRGGNGWGNDGMRTRGRGSEQARKRKGIKKE